MYHYQLDFFLHENSVQSISSIVGIFAVRNSSSDSKPSVKLDKQLLTKLRKETGFGFSKCHEALALHNNEYSLAEAWLHEQAQKEGWAKATKLRDRNAAEGLIGVLVKDNFAAMVEVNKVLTHSLL